MKRAGNSTLLPCCVMALCAAAMHTAYGVSDYQWTFSNDDDTDYLIASVSSPRVFDGALNAPDPDIALIVGKRYEITVESPLFHPIEIIGQSSNITEDVVLLSQGAVDGTFESDAVVNWTDDMASANGKVEFTVTQGLVAAMTQNGHTPGYRCNIHVQDMRGNFVVSGMPISDPIPGPIEKGAVTVELDPVVSGLASPLGVDFPDDGTDRMFAYDQVGKIWVVDSGVLVSTPVLDVTDRLVSLNANYDERGLLGMALHPDFATNGKLYTYTSEPVDGTADFTVSMPAGASFNHQSVLAEWVLSPPDSNVVDPASRREILRIDEPQSNHNGGALHFGPDGMLYIALGDGGAARDQGNGHGDQGNGQNTDTILGSILRIDVNGGGNVSVNGQYGIPVDNPFVGAAGLDELYAYGLRNPYSFHFDSVTGTLYAGDVGQNNIEEIDIIISGGNYGWHIEEGTFYMNPNTGYVMDVPWQDNVPEDLIDPIAEYDHDEGTAVIGGFVEHSGTLPGLKDLYVAGDLGIAPPSSPGRLLYLDAANAFHEIRIGVDDRGLGTWLKGFAQDPEGKLYVCVSQQLGPTGTTGAVYRLVPSAADYDGDGLPDNWEVQYGLDPTDNGSVDPNNGALGNPDGDSWTNAEEFAMGTNPRVFNGLPALSPLGLALLMGTLCWAGALRSRPRLRLARTSS